MDKSVVFIFTVLLNSTDCTLTIPSLFLGPESIDILYAKGITKFIIIAENVLNFHSSDDSYYEEWREQLLDDGGWVVIIDMPQQSQYDFKKARLTNYVSLMDFPQWRTLKPDVIFQQVDNWIMKLLE